MPRKGYRTLRKGTTLYHGAWADPSAEIEQGLVLHGRHTRKSGGGTLDEGGLIWFTPDKSVAEWYAKGPEMWEQVAPGKVFAFKLGEPLKMVDRRLRLNAEEAAIINKALNIPDYKEVDAGDSLSIAVHRAFDSGGPFDYYETEGGRMKVIWPIVLDALGVDALVYSEKQIGIPADEITVKKVNPLRRIR